MALWHRGAGGRVGKVGTHALLQMKTHVYGRGQEGGDPVRSAPYDKHEHDAYEKRRGSGWTGGEVTETHGRDRLRAMGSERPSQDSQGAEDRCKGANKTEIPRLLYEGSLKLSTISVPTNHH